MTSGHALRLILVWDFTFRSRAAVEALTGQTPRWRSLGWRGHWLRARAQWNWRGECRSIQAFFRAVGLSSDLTDGERRFIRLGLSGDARATAGEFCWQIEAAACLAWALRVLPRLWPMDEQFDGQLDAATLASPERRLVESADLRPPEEIAAARERVKLWHWRARQLALERQGCAWPPPETSPETVAGLRTEGLDSLDGIARATARRLREEGALDQTIEDDFAAKGKPYRQLSQDEAGELEAIAAQRHKALNWLAGLAPDNNWTEVPLET